MNNKKLYGIILVLILSCVWGIGHGAAEKSYLNIGFELMKKEAIGSLRIGTPASDVIHSLGEPERTAEVIVWAADGLEHQDWFYCAQGIKLNMIKQDGKQTVSRIRITYPSKLKTTRGIGIGSTALELKTAYGDEINPATAGEVSRIVAGTIYGGIIFTLEDGKVSAIFIGAAAE